MSMRVLLLAVVAVFAAAVAVRAEEAAKEVTLKGTLTCAHCDLKKTDACQNALKVTDDGKDVVYYLTANDVSKPEHKAVCHGPVDGVSVTGTVSEKDGQKWLTASKIEMPKKVEGEGHSH